MANQAVGSTLEQYQKKYPHSCVTLQGLTPMSGGPFSSCDNDAYTFVFESGHFAFWGSDFKHNDINTILKSIDDERGKPSAISPDRWSWGLPNAKNGPLLVTMTPQSYWQFDGNRAAVDRFLGYKAIQAKEEAQRKQAAQQTAESAPAPGLDTNNSVLAIKPAPVIGWHGVAMGQIVNSTHNYSVFETIHTDCFNYFDLNSHLSIVNGRLDYPMTTPDPVLQAAYQQEEADWAKGKRISYCMFRLKEGTHGVWMINVKTRQTPRELIAAFSKLYGPPVPGMHGLTSNDTDSIMWVFPPPNPTPEIILVRPEEAQDPQTLERFVICYITFKLDD